MEDGFCIRGGLPVPAIIELEVVTKDEGACPKSVTNDQWIAVIVYNNFYGWWIGEYNCIEWIACAERIGSCPCSTGIYETNQLYIPYKRRTNFLL